MDASELEQRGHLLTWAPEPGHPVGMLPTTYQLVGGTAYFRAVNLRTRTVRGELIEGGRSGGWIVHPRQIGPRCWADEDSQVERDALLEEHVLIGAGSVVRSGARLSGRLTLMGPSVESGLLVRGTASVTGNGRIEASPGPERWRVANGEAVVVGSLEVCAPLTAWPPPPLDPWS